MILRSATLTVFWLALAAYCVLLGFGPAVELRFGEEALPTAIASVASITVIFWLVWPPVRARILGWSRLIAISGVLSVVAVLIVSRITDGFSCDGSCFGVVNDILGYACGEWPRGCVAEWFSLFLVGFSLVLALPNHRYFDRVRIAGGGK